MKGAKEIRKEFYGTNDSRAFDEDEIALMEKYATQSKFKLPTGQQLAEIALLFNEGKLERKKLIDMVAMCQFVVDRLYENGDVLKASSKEK